MARKNSDYSPENLIPFNEPLSREFLMKKAEAELNETDEIREECLEQLKALIKEHKLRCITDDDFLLRFLRTKKFKVQRSFQTLQNYCKERVALHRLFSNIQPETMEACIRNTIYGILPYRDYEGRLIYFFREGKWDESICTLEEAIISGFIALCYAVEDESAQINGIHFLVDETYFSLRNSLLSLPHMRLRRNFLFNSIPLRYHCIDIANEPLHMKIVVTLVMPILPEKLRKRLILHGQRKDVLFQHIPQCLLEKKSESSTEDPLINHQLIGILKEYLQKFKEEHRYFVSEQ